MLLAPWPADLALLITLHDFPSRTLITRLVTALTQIFFLGTLEALDRLFLSSPVYQEL